MFTAVLGVVAVVGVLSVSVYSLLSGPIRTAATVTAKTKAINNMITTAKVLLSAASDEVPKGGDGDGIPEAPPFVTDPIFPSAGVLPTNLGVELTDPWGTLYAYCTWDHGTTNNSANRLDGLNGDPVDINAKFVVVIISAGPNRAFEMSCEDINNTGDDGLDVSTIIDDFYEKFTVADAASLTGGGESIWDIVSPEEIKYDERVGIGGGADATAKLNVTGDTKVSGALSGFSGVFTNLTASKIDIAGDTGSEIDGTIIGANTAAAGTFTNITATGNITATSGTSTFSTVDINGGTIDATTIGATAPQTGRFTALRATSLDMNDGPYIADFHTITVIDTNVVTNLNSEFLYDSGIAYDPGMGLVPAFGPRPGNFYRYAGNLNAGQLDPARLPTFGGDATLSGTSPTTVTATVTGLQGRNISTNTPNPNEVLAWNGSTWIPSTVGDGGIAVAETDPTIDTKVNDIGKKSVWTGECDENEIPKATSGGGWSCSVDAGGFTNPATTTLNMNGYKIINVSAVQMTSDFRLKKDIQPMSSMLKRLEQIEPVTFHWNDFAKKKGYDNDKHLGLIAQDVEKIFPEAIITNEQGIKGIDYGSLSAVMLQAIRELSEQNKMLQGQINDLKRQQNQ